jgi:long-subunit acyl-CoA synthetase (AMP-forming)
MASSTWHYFSSLGVPIMDFYGMSECTGPQTVALPNCFRRGFCGRALPGFEMRLDHVEGRDGEGEGEVWFRGRHVMMGYLDDPEKTKEAIDPNGWLR